MSNHSLSMHTAVRTSPMISEVWGFQPNTRLSLPHESSKSGSCLHQDKERTPFSWPVRILSGARAFRRSQTMMIGDMSSSEEVTNLVAYDKGGVKRTMHRR